MICCANFISWNVDVLEDKRIRDHCTRSESYQERFEATKRSRLSQNRTLQNVRPKPMRFDENNDSKLAAVQFS